MRTICLLFLCAVLIGTTSGCAVYMATNQPRKHNLAVLKPGTERDLVVAELGAPVTSEAFGEGRKDIYTFVQGYGKLTKAGRALFHGVADVFTIGLWEVVGTPLESAFDGKRISVRVIYDSNGRVKESTTLSIEEPKEADKSLEPTALSVTTRACARLAPSSAMAHLWR